MMSWHRPCLWCAIALLSTVPCEASAGARGGAQGQARPIDTVEAPPPPDARKIAELQSSAEQIALAFAQDPDEATLTRLTPDVSVSMGISHVTDVEFAAPEELEVSEEFSGTGREAFENQSRHARELTQSLDLYGCRAIESHAFCRIESSERQALGLVWLRAQDGLITRIRVRLLLREPSS